jgi:hypothetical protein
MVAQAILWGWRRGRWSESEYKANSAQLKLELGLSLAKVGNNLKSNIQTFGFKNQ